MDRHLTLSGKRKKSHSQILLNLLFVIICACYILPFMMVVTIALSNTRSVASEGFKIFPTAIDFTALKAIFRKPEKILQAYKITIEFTLLHTVLAVILQALIAYPLSKSYFTHRKALTWYIFFTMLFNAGMIPTYLTNVKVLGLGNSFWAYVFPGVVSAWNVMVVRTFYVGIPNELFEAARIDGAGELRTFFEVVVPLSKPCYATIGFLTLVGKWNDWNTALVYIRDPKLYSLQYLLQTMLRNAEELEKIAESALGVDMTELVSTEPMRFAMALVAAGPVLLIFPWFQKYFSKGLTVGAVKG